jgi:DNA-binding NtrC family response regulator
MTTTAVAVEPLRRRISARPPSPEWEKSAAPRRKIPRRVLVVDDEPLIRWSVAETISREGLDVEQASDAASALRVVTTDSLDFDVIVLDLRLPDMKDLSLLATIRQLRPQTVIVLMTAYGTDEVVERAVALGASTVLAKPFAMERLLDAVFGAAA